MPLASPIAVLFVCVVLFVASITDLKSRTIPNVLPGLLLLGFAIALFFTSDLRDVFLLRLATFSVALLVGFLFFTFKVMGGGDVKLFATLAIWHDFTSLGHLAISTAFAGAGVALFFALMDFGRRYRAYTKKSSIWKVFRESLKVRIPYGVGIFLGQLILFVQN